MPIYLKIDADFLKIESADSTDAFLKIEDSAQVKHDINGIGDTFIKLGALDHKMGVVAEALDAFLLKLSPPAPTSTADAAAVTTPNPQADFLKIDAALQTTSTDLGTLGTDFLKLDTAPNLATWKSDVRLVSDDFLKLSTDSTNTGAAFARLGNDLVTLGTGSNTNATDLNNAFKLLGGELLKVGAPSASGAPSPFDALAADWLKLSDDFATVGGPPPPPTTASVSASATTAPGTLGTDFLKLDRGLSLLDQALAGTIPGVTAVFDALDHKHKGEQLLDQFDHLFATHAHGSGGGAG